MGIQPGYGRETVDRLFAAWYVESWYYGHHYRFYSYSPWHTCGNGTRYDSEAAAKAAVDGFMDVWIAAALREKGRMYCPFCSKLAHVHQCVECWGCGWKG